MSRMKTGRHRIPSRPRPPRPFSLRPPSGMPKAVLHDSQGMALILTLMVLAIIFAMVVEFAYEIYVSAAALHNWEIAQRLSLLARSGVKLAAKTASDRALKYPYTYPGVLEIPAQKLFEGYEGVLSLRVEDENSKFNLKSLIFPNGIVNAEARNSLLRLLRALALNPDIADRIIDWVDLDREPRLPDSENGAKNRNLDSLDEILLIPGITETDYEKLRPYVTIYGSDFININGAPIPVLMSLSDSIDRGKAERVVRYRETLPFERAQDILKVAGFETIGQTLMGRITVQGTTFRIISTAREGDIKRIIESVVEKPNESAMIFYWKEI
jgi:general secretion pathway protein K